MHMEDISDSIMNGHYKDTQELIRQALKEGTPVTEILMQGLLPAMRRVEELYGNQTLYIPNILASARCMKRGLEILQPYLECGEYAPVAKVILGTVQGDLHEIGKNLVGIIFRSYGFEVVDLGVDVSEKQFLKAIREHPDASIVLISSLLTTTMREMRQIVKAIRHYDRERRLKIMVGGGPVTQEFADEIGADAYTETALEAAKLARGFFP